MVLILLPLWDKLVTRVATAMNVYVECRVKYLHSLHVWCQIYCALSKFRIVQKMIKFLTNSKLCALIVLLNGIEKPD